MDIIICLLENACIWMHNLSPVLGFSDTIFVLEWQLHLFRSSHHAITA
jgi:hypothetical protein